nr:hypothetical protein [Burkholderia ambifaria]
MAQFNIANGEREMSTGNEEKAAGLPEHSLRDFVEEAKKFGLTDDEIEYLGHPIKAARYIDKYHTSKDVLANAIGAGKIRSVLCRGVLWVQDRNFDIPTEHASTPAGHRTMSNGNRKKAIGLLALTGIVSAVLYAGMQANSSDSAKAAWANSVPQIAALQPSSPTTEQRSTGQPAQPTPPAAEAKWLYKEEHDSMRDKTYRVALLPASNVLDFDFPYNGGSHVLMIINGEQGRKLAHPVLEIDKGQFDCGTDGCDLTVKFDDQLQSYHAQLLTSRRLYIWYREGRNSVNGEEDEFIKNLRASHHMIIEARFYEDGARQIEFDTTGFPL